MHQEHAVGHVDHGDALHALHGLDDLVGVRVVAGADGQVTHLELPVGAHDVHRARVAPLPGDDAQNFRNIQ